MSTLPNSFNVLSSNDCNEARALTSDVQRRVLHPFDSIDLAASSTCSTRRDVATTSAPASASPLAIARPIPEVPPITTATFPLRSNNGCPIHSPLQISVPMLRAQLQP